MIIYINNVHDTVYAVFATCKFAWGLYADFDVNVLQRKC